ncbi:MAG: hypothetical protein AAFY32_09890 [Pseudomonadota bacterium]
MIWAWNHQHGRKAGAKAGRTPRLPGLGNVARRLVSALAVVFMVLGALACEPAGSGRLVGPAAPTDTQVEVLVGGDRSIDAARIDQGAALHRALSQFFRWFLFYDNDRIAFDDHLAMLSPEATFQKDDESFSAREHYIQRALALPRTMDSAHFPRRIRAYFADDKRIRLDADLIYLNRGALPEGRVHANHLTYSMLTLDQAPAPLVEEVKIMVGKGGVTPTFRKAYAQNRLRSAAHFWLSLLDDPAHPIDPVRPLFSPVFTVNVSGKRLTDFEALADWLNGPDYGEAPTHHVIRTFAFEELVANEFEIEMDLDRYVIKDGVMSRVTVRQNILVQDNPGAPYPLITLITERSALDLQEERAQSNLSVR